MKNLVIYGETIKYYTADAVDEFIEALKIKSAEWKLKKRKTKQYYNTPCAFDIETTSTYIDGEKTAWMYVWQLGLDDLYIIGRTWREFIDTLELISQTLELSADKQLVVYVHNLAYEFQFMRRYLLWDEVFATDERKPVSALCNLGIRFKCSYILTNMSLNGVGKNLQRYRVNKLVGDLDYSLIRTAETPLTDNELRYCINDIRVVIALIREKIEDDGDITRIPLTNTGYVRQYTRRQCLYKYNGKKKFKRTQSTGYKYYNLMQQLKLHDGVEYRMLKRAFQGGFTHASIWNTNTTHTAIASYDITSSYPTVMIAEKFPMSRGFKVTVRNGEQFKNLLKKYCCMFDVKFYGICQKSLTTENYLSESKCYHIKNGTFNNGRISYADELTTTITEIDWDIINRCYEFDGYAVGDMICYTKQYLPKPFIECILHFYEGKTTLKGVTGKETEYMNLKGMLNSLYGMTVTDICRPEYIYDDEWTTRNGDINKQVDEYNESKNRFLFFPWGIWVTAYARRNLFDLILECDKDYIYSDTDSVKMKNAELHAPFINAYNLAVEAKINKCLDFYHIPRKRATPRDIHGKTHILGVFDNETANGEYLKFKTLGAKRYMYEDCNGKYHMTVAGLSKHTAIKFLYRRYNYNVIMHRLTGTPLQDIMDMFNDNLYIPSEWTGKQTHTYIDTETQGYITDYTGHVGYYDALSSVHLEGADYSLNIADEYIKYIRGYVDIWSRQYD